MGKQPRHGAPVILFFVVLAIGAAANLPRGVSDCRIVTLPWACVFPLE